MTKPRLDLDRYHWKRDLGEFTLIGTWWIDGQRNSPCMVIIRRGEQTHEHTSPCVIMMDDAWYYSPQIGDPKVAATAVMNFLQALRLDPHQFTNVVRIHLMIEDHLGDLLSIPPYSQPDTGDLIAEVTIKDNKTGKTLEVEIKDDV